MRRNILKNRAWATTAFTLGLVVLGGTHTALAAKPTPPPPPPPPPIVDQNIVYNMGADIRIMNADGTGDRSVFAQAGVNYTNIKPRWSPEDNADPARRQIVFAGNPPATAGGVGSGIYTVDLDGSNLRQICPAPVFTTPDWSPLPLPGTGELDETGRPTDADWILYEDFGPEQPDGSMFCDIFAVRRDGAIRINLTNTPDFDEEYPVWSPSADRFAASVYDVDRTTGLDGQTINNIVVYTISIVNGLPQISTVTVTPAYSNGWCVDWARTQEKVFYIPGGSPRELRTVDVTTGNIQVITSPVYDASISPDDTKIAYQEFQGNIYVSDANGANRVLIKSIAGGRRNSSAPMVSLDWRRYSPPGNRFQKI